MEEEPSTWAINSQRLPKAWCNGSGIEDISGRNCGTSAAIVNTGGNLGGLLAPVVTVYVAKTYGWNAGFFVASLVCLLGVALWFGIRLEHPGKQQETAN